MTNAPNDRYYFFVALIFFFSCLSLAFCGCVPVTPKAALRAKAQMRLSACLNAHPWPNDGQCYRDEAAYCQEIGLGLERSCGYLPQEPLRFGR